VVDALADAGIAVLGTLMREERFALADRHLGLVQAQEHADLAARIAGLADLADRNLDLDAIVARARPLTGAAHRAAPALRPPGQRIALAADRAFSFIYPHLVDGWRRAGAEIVPFSPLADEPPPEPCDCAWLPGGYPELQADALAAARGFRNGLVRFARTRPVHGECGGYMVLGETLTDRDGVAHPMAGLLGHSTSFAQRKLHLGYREARLIADSAIGSAGQVIRGHEFHYATLSSPGRDAPLAELADAQGQQLGTDGGRRGHVTGTFFHAIAVV
jgi:cobyrinic acid a,c-diamide synthase